MTVNIQEEKDSESDGMICLASSFQIDDFTYNEKKMKDFIVPLWLHFFFFVIGAIPFFPLEMIYIYPASR